MNRETYNGHEIRVQAYNGLRNAVFVDGLFTGEAGFFSVEAALAYGERLIDGGL
jgi:hypothetical protein